jgi:hypothetical protein
MNLDAATRHLTYGLQIHPGESWSDIRTTILEKAAVVRNRLCSNRPFGLGVRLSGKAAGELASPEARRAAKAMLGEKGFYVFTLNGFAHGPLAPGVLKEKVYQPDWRTTTRREYTIQLIDILADWLPDGMCGSINTLPGSYKPWILRRDDPNRMVRELVDCVLHLVRLQDLMGKEIQLCLEPQPGCYLESTEETVGFFRERLFVEGVKEVTRRSGVSPDRAEAWIRRHIGVCLDTCALAVQFEDLLASWAVYRREGIRIAKVQLSAGLEVFNERSRIEALHPFVEPTYLHPVKALTRHGAIRSWNDLPDALRIVKDQAEYERLRIDFRVPLYWAGTAQLSTTAMLLNDAVWSALGRGPCNHFEVETQPVDVMPTGLRPASAEDCSARELEWVLDRWRRGSPPVGPTTS